ncbi:hypothetical protein RHMOL_Rhmol06G0143100 [Rhododendron molle]|uniref:Uncharacterized protein n=1 Tax=Rhododendron molle TaxID=49168 RepID=A0ACC0NC50_RHOML|nr:hypothetical protein RHMOL_Rhmol06G0143100 [Rhododendron molle]
MPPSLLPPGSLSPFLFCWFRLPLLRSTAGLSHLVSPVLPNGVVGRRAWGGLDRAASSRFTPERIRLGPTAVGLAYGTMGGHSSGLRPSADRVIPEGWCAAALRGLVAGFLRPFVRVEVTASWRGSQWWWSVGLHGASGVDGSRFLYGDLGLPGFSDASNPCCEVATIGVLCKRGGSTCAKRTHHVFFDGLHPTEAVNELIARNAYASNLENEVYPVNIKELVRM